LGAATVVVEAPKKSGSIITAKYALELGRDVYAVPADALRESAYGSNRLIADGAIPLLNPGELIENLLGENKKIDAFSPEPHNQNEAALLKALAISSGHADELAELTGLPAASVLSGLTALELRGAVIALGAMRYSLKHKTKSV
jgi:DNA processing protein